MGSRNKKRRQFLAQSTERAEAFHRVIDFNSAVAFLAIQKHEKLHDEPAVTVIRKESSSKNKSLRLSTTLRCASLTVPADTLHKAFPGKHTLNGKVHMTHDMAIVKNSRVCTRTIMYQ